ncbi:hypothetical protein CC117_16840 [Parafrankia colletiae]|uniref:Uncharacterized protein n=1 Tax=Parafrankia colletiae TaxID=573497 RepID=A0A1S1QWH8_9ACTN|nr:hypothetical protein CC117_16840 [Parafrankia colletiae]
MAEVPTDLAREGRPRERGHQPFAVRGPATFDEESDPDEVAGNPGSDYSRAEVIAPGTGATHRARAEDVLHWQHHQRPISAETLRKQLHVGAATARKLVAQIRSDTHVKLDSQPPEAAAP